MKKLNNPAFCGLWMIACSLLGIFALCQKDHPPVIGILFIAVAIGFLFGTIRGLVRNPQ